MTRAGEYTLAEIQKFAESRTTTRIYYMPKEGQLVRIGERRSKKLPTAVLESELEALVPMYFAAAGPRLVGRPGSVRATLVGPWSAPQPKHTDEAITMMNNVEMIDVSGGLGARNHRVADEIRLEEVMIGYHALAAGELDCWRDKAKRSNAAHIESQATPKINQPSISRQATFLRRYEQTFVVVTPVGQPPMLFWVHPAKATHADIDDPIMLIPYRLDTRHAGLPLSGLHLDNPRLVSAEKLLELQKRGRFASIGKLEYIGNQSNQRDDLRRLHRLEVMELKQAVDGALARAVNEIQLDTGLCQ